MSNHPRVCTSCGHVGKGKKVIKGLFLAEIAIYLFALFAGFIIHPIIGFGIFLVALAYSFYRIISQKTVCEKCGNSTLIPTDSPRGREMIGAKKP